MYGEDSPHQPPPRVKTPEGVNSHSELFELIGSPLLANLRHFQMGGAVPEPDGWCDCHTGFPEIEHVVASMPRIEVLDLYCKYYESADLFKLTNLTNLRELRIYHLGGYQWGRQHTSTRLDVPATNPSLANLTHLLFHPHQPEGMGTRRIDTIPIFHSNKSGCSSGSKHLKKLTHLQLRLSDMGDDGIRAIIASGILKQLKWLDLQHGGVTDEGASLLAACPDAKRLERIDLSRNGGYIEGTGGPAKSGCERCREPPAHGGPNRCPRVPSRGRFRVVLRLQLHFRIELLHAACGRAGRPGLAGSGRCPRSCPACRGAAVVTRSWNAVMPEG